MSDESNEPCPAEADEIIAPYEGIMYPSPHPDDMAAYGANFGSAWAASLSSLFTLLGYEVNPTAMAVTVGTAALRSRFDRRAIVAAIVENATTIFPDDQTRPFIINALSLLGSGMPAAGGATP